MNTDRKYDVAIVGGGLAGLSLSILLARAKYRVCVFEKESYPFHKVCGEYISFESHEFLASLGLPLNKWNLPRIHELLITSPSGLSITEHLPLGGFGISRYKLDAALADMAKKTGVDVFENTKVHHIRFEQEQHDLETSSGLFTAAVACACYGKKSNLDVKWKRRFLKQDTKQNYVGVKYHVRCHLPGGQIALHNFQGGYCGISEIEDGLYCLCYLTDSENLKKNGQSIQEMEKNVLKKNPVLQSLLNSIQPVYKEPVTIAQISFAKKSQIENHVLCIGDAAGMISPLCGNGMSMALHGSKIAAGSIQHFLQNRGSRKQMETDYRKKWTHAFARRLRSGRFLQLFFGHSVRSTLLIRLLKPFPFLIRAIIRQTHGREF